MHCFEIISQLMQMGVKFLVRIIPSEYYILQWKQMLVKTRIRLLGSFNLS